MLNFLPGKRRLLRLRLTFGKQRLLLEVFKVKLMLSATTTPDFVRPLLFLVH